jgi:tetratricopeptide (TPR) repeat protein
MRRPFVSRSSRVHFLALGVAIIVLGCQSAGDRETGEGGRWEAAEVLYQQGQYEQSLAVLREILLEDPKHVNANFRSGVIHHRAGRFRDAVAFYQRTVELKPDHLKAHYNLGQIFSKDTIDLKSAQDHLKRFLALGPPPDLKSEAERMLASIEAQLAKLRSGPGGLPSATTPGRFPAEDAKAPPQSLPGTLKTKKAKDRVAAKTGKSARPEAIRPRGAAQELQALAWVSRGDAAGAVDEKISAYREAARLDPSLDEAHAKLGKTYQAKGMLREAEASMREAVRLRPSSPAAHEGLLDVLEDQGRKADALAAARQYARSRPDVAASWERLGGLEARAGNAKGAADAFQKSLQIDASRVSVHYQLGVLYDKSLKAPDKARIHYEKYLQMAPNGPEAKTVRKRLRDL